MRFSRSFFLGLLGALLVVVAGLAVTTPAQAAGADIRINEVESSGGTPGDWVELRNIGSAAADISGLKVKDNDDTHAFSVIPAGTTVAAGGYYVVEESALGFGLGSADSARLFDTDGSTLIDSYSWTTHASTTYGRCPDGTGSFTTTAASTKGAANACAAVVPDVRINEVESNGDQVADWVELANNGANPVDVSGWKILDNDPAHAPTPVVVPAGTSIPAGGHYALYTEIGQSPGFGLGGADSATLYLPDGTTQVDTYSWTTHAATSYGRCPDGTGAFATTTTPTRGLANACSPIRLNEIESSGGTPGDWIELVNISANPIDLGGWVLKDNDDTHTFPIPAGTTIPAHGYQVFDETQLGFGLGSADSARLFDGIGALVESYSWSAHATQTYGRCKDGVGDFTDTKAPTKGTSNSCPGLETQLWPGPQTVTTADLTDTFVQDLSGLVFDPADPDVLWAAQNKKGTLFKLVRNGDTWLPAGGWPKDPKYVDGTGAPDTEGITIGPDGFVYLAAERNNDASGVSRMSILRYDPHGTGSTLTATNEWNLTGLIPAAGANLGLEGVTFVPDSYLVAHGFKDQGTGAAYDPSAYPLHGSGLYFVAVEATGNLIGFALDSDGTTAHKVATVDSGFTAVADVDFDPELGRLRAVTDDTVDGKTSLLKIDASGSFVVDTAYQRPAGMPNLNNEGLAVAPQSRCVDGLKEVLWSDDGDTDGHSLRRGAISCTPIVDPAITATVSSSVPKNAAGWYRTPVTITFVCSPGSAALADPCPAPVTLSTDGADQSVTRGITATDGGAATVTVSDLDIDTTGPKVAVGTVQDGHLYVYLFRPLVPTCVGTDATSGIASCTVTTTKKGAKWTSTATATDRAGNVATTTVTYTAIVLFG